MKLTVLQSVSVPARAGSVNDDACGQAPDCAFVIDGATGLGGRILPERHGSDAAWLATFCKEYFERDTLLGNPLPDIVRGACRDAAQTVDQTAAGAHRQLWQLPVAGFSMLRIEDGRSAHPASATACCWHWTAMDICSSTARWRPGGSRTDLCREGHRRAGGLSKISSLVKTRQR
ncbi:MAG: hypothetical protein H6891_07425 [Brucellaceae bacterium]|nr:hypothetical protein [Brucellaceae bacterium]